MFLNLEVGKSEVRLRSVAKVRVLFVLSAFVPALGLFGKPMGWMLCLYSVFVTAYACDALQWRGAFSRLPLWGAGAASAVAVGTLTESLAWLQNYGEGFQKQGALFSPHLWQDIAIGWGYYLGLVLAYLVVSRFFSFSAAESFIGYGVAGVFLEQRGAVASSAFAAGAAGIVILVYVFVVHGSILGLIVLPLERRTGTGPRRWYRWILFEVLIVAFAFAGTALSSAVFKK